MDCTQWAIVYTGLPLCHSLSCMLALAQVIDLHGRILDAGPLLLACANEALYVCMDCLMTASGGREQDK
jgi:hypothetical protein